MPSSSITYLQVDNSGQRKSIIYVPWLLKVSVKCIDLFFSSFFCFCFFWGGGVTINLTFQLIDIVVTSVMTDCKVTSFYSSFL